jgi:DNA-binding response OmpR family regulator
MKKVLVVEDDAFIRDISTIKLSDHGYAVTAVQNGANAIEALAQQDFDVVLLDLELPDMQGKDILAQMRAVTKHTKTPVIVFSNRDEDEVKQVVTQLGITGYFVKASTEYSEVFACIDALP